MLPELNKTRINCLDIAKGIGILIVLVEHAIGQYGKNGFYGEAGLGMYELSLFFVISGMFFSTTNSFMAFLSKKINRLVIPFVFFYFTTVIVIPITLAHFWNCNLNSYFGYSFKGLFIDPFTYEVSANGPIWFILSLIFINFLYYAITLFSELLQKKLNIHYAKYYISFIIGICGLLLAYCGINIPAHIDSSMSALPFFCIGDFLFRSTDFANEKKYRSQKYLIFSLITLLFIGIISVPIDYRGNTFEGCGYLMAYPLGLAGTLSIITLSKILTFSKFLTYCGRFSLVLLCTHAQIQQIIRFAITDRFEIYGWKGILVNTIITVPLCLLLCYLANKLIPFLIGQGKSTENTRNI